MSFDPNDTLYLVDLRVDRAVPNMKQPVRSSASVPALGLLKVASKDPLEYIYYDKI
jgi:hypothetical protein